MSGKVLAVAALAIGLSGPIHAGCSLPQDEAAQFDESRAVVKAEVVSAEPFETETGAIRTRYVLRVVEAFKGDAPATFEVISDGGKLGNRASVASSALNFKAGKSYVLLLTLLPDGTWSTSPHRAFHAPANRPDVSNFFRGKARGKRPVLQPSSSPENGDAAVQTTTTSANSGVPGSVVTPTGYTQPYGHPGRWLNCDGGEPIPYLIDVDPALLPAGMDQNGALAAVQEALNAWSSASSLRFRFAGFQAFGTAAGNLSPGDKTLRLQLHDKHNFISDNGVLGRGGGSLTVDAATFHGGQLGSQGFQSMTDGYAVLNHRPASMDVAIMFKQVLTHEIGHALGLCHSSENNTEPEPILKNATMYWKASNDGRGAALTIYDQDRIAYGYGNLPPAGFDRILPAVTATNVNLLPVTPGCNQLRIRAMDRENASLSWSLVSATSANGTFSIAGNLLTYRPSINADVGLGDDQIATGYAYDRAVLRVSDGANFSPPIDCAVVSYASDTTPADGLPDAWMIAHFGSKNTGVLGSGRHPDDDPDKDGLSNRAEFYLRTNPNSAVSGRLTPVYNAVTRELTFTPQRFAPYVVEVSPALDAGTWNSRRMFTRYDAATSAVSMPVTDGAAPREFFRIVTGP